MTMELRTQLKIVRFAEARIDGLQMLLSRYRFGKPPTEKQWEKYEKSKEEWETLILNIKGKLKRM